MNHKIKQDRTVLYFNANEAGASFEFGRALYGLLQKHSYQERSVVFLCIGSDRATGDCLGPILGYKLAQLKSKRYKVYGTLEKPVHAKNLQETIAHIYQTEYNPLIIAIDASLGQSAHIGYFTLGEGPLKPGAGVQKELPSVGDLFITGIVNLSGFLDHMLLQTTRLSTVMSLADRIHLGIYYCINKTGTALN